MSKYNGIKLQFTYPHSLAPKNPQKHCVEPIEVDKNSLSKTRSELVENAVILYQEYFQQTAVASLEVLCIDPLPLPTPFPTFRQYSYVCLTLRECLICHKYVHKQYIYLVRVVENKGTDPLSQTLYFCKFATQCCRSQIFKTVNAVILNN